MTGAIAPTKPLTALDVCDRMVRIYNGVIAEGVDEAAFRGHSGLEVTS